MNRRQSTRRPGRKLGPRKTETSDSTVNDTMSHIKIVNNGKYILKFSILELYSIHQ